MALFTEEELAELRKQDSILSLSRPFDEVKAGAYRALEIRNACFGLILSRPGISTHELCQALPQYTPLQVGNALRYDDRLRVCGGNESSKRWEAIKHGPSRRQRSVDVQLTQEENADAVYQTIRKHQPINVHKVADMLGISYIVVSRLSHDDERIIRKPHGKYRVLLVTKEGAK